MENQNYGQPNPPQQAPSNTIYTGQLAVPDSTAVLVLGILSIVFCCCYGVIGLVLGIIALVLANKGNQFYILDPAKYTLTSFNNLKAGKICAIIGLSISALYIIFLVIAILINGFKVDQMPYDMYNY